MYIILLNGHAGCLKTTLSYLLASNLGFAHISTSTLGSFTSDKNNENFILFRDLRYKRMFELAEKHLDFNVSIILDGNFPSKKKRETVYHLAERFNVKDIISIKCICSDPEKLKDRFKFRENNPSAPDSNANTIDVYWSSVSDYEDNSSDFYNNRRVSQLEFDSGNFTIKTLNTYDNISSEIFDLIQLIIDTSVLEKPFFLYEQK